jgi:signal peptidase I
MKFEQFLVLAVVITGFIWLLDSLLFRAKRNKAAAGGGGSAVQTNAKEPILVEYAKSFFPVLLFVLVLRSFLLEPFRIPSPSMYPTLLEGDFIVINKYNYGIRLPVLGMKIVPIGSPQPGDVVVFRHGDMDMIKRVIALPGDTIEYKDNYVYINGKQLPQEYLGKSADFDAAGNSFVVEKMVETITPTKKHEIYKRADVPQVNYPYNKVTVPAGHYFVMGDNRNNSADSRFWGFLSDKDLIGRAFATWMSWDAANNDVRWERVFKKIP